jgi:hypothetical protein
LTRTLRCALACWVGLVWTPAATAQPPHARLIWSHPVDSTCPSAEVLQREVELLLGRSAFSSDRDPDVVIEGDVEELETGTRARLLARAADGSKLGERVLHAPAGECASLRRPLSLVLVMLLDHSQPSKTTVAKSPRALDLGAFVAGASGALPRVSAGGGLEFALEVAPRLRLHGDAWYWLPVRVETSRGTGARFQAFGAAFAACPRPSRAGAALGVSICASATLGAMLASPRALDGPPRQSRLLALVGLDLRLMLRMSRIVSMEGALGPALFLTRPRYFLSRADGSPLDVHQPALFGALFRLSVLFSTRAHN